MKSRGSEALSTRGKLDTGSQRDHTGLLSAQRRWETGSLRRPVPVPCIKHQMPPPPALPVLFRMLSVARTTLESSEWLFTVKACHYLPVVLVCFNMSGFRGGAAWGWFFFLLEVRSSSLLLNSQQSRELPGADYISLKCIFSVFKCFQLPPNTPPGRLGKWKD